MIFINYFLLFILVSTFHITDGFNTDGDNVTISATVDSWLNIRVRVTNRVAVHSHSRVTGYAIYFTRDADIPADEYRNWSRIEILADENEYEFELQKEVYKVELDRVYRLRASVFINHIESIPTSVYYLNTREAVVHSPTVQSTNLFPNNSLVIHFLPADGANAITNYTIEYRDSTSLDDLLWQRTTFLSDSSNLATIENLHVNRTYIARLFITGTAVPGEMSKQFEFSTFNAAELPLVSLTPSFVSSDPELTTPLEIQCTAISRPSSSIQWLVNDQSVHLDHSFYTITSAVDAAHSSSIIRAKSRSRSDVLTCIASNPAGEVSKSVYVRIKGPGSPPSTVTVTADRENGYIVSWLPPSHPNGEIKKYVVYHSLNREDPLSDWNKLDLDGSERSVKVITENNSFDGFYVRVQAATHDGPGIISDVVGIERDTQPISVWIKPYQKEFNKTTREYQLEPNRNTSITCSARGKPRPILYFAVSEHQNATDVEDDVWQSLSTHLEGENSTGTVHLSLISSRFAHCKARNSAGYNISSINLVVNKPGDAPRNVAVASIDSREIVLIWEQPLHPNQAIQSYEVLLSTENKNTDEIEEPLILHTKANELSTFTKITIPSEQLKASVPYTVEIRAVNEFGVGPLSDKFNFITPNGGPELAPFDVSVVIDESNTPILSWTQPNCSGQIDSYIVYFTKDLGLLNDNYKEWQTTEIPASITGYRYKLDHRVGMKPKSFYRLRMTANNAISEGPPSAIIEFETAHSILPIPTDISLQLDEDNTLHIIFLAVTDPDDNTRNIETYKIELVESETALSTKWYTATIQSTTLDRLTNKVELTVDGSDLTPHSGYWVRATAVVDNANRLVQSSKPVFVRTGRGKLRTRASIDGEQIVKRDPSITEKISFTCRAEGSPAPAIQWMWKDEIVPSEDTDWVVEEEIIGRKRVSTLTHLGVRESGELSCFSFNTEGNATATVQLVVLGPGTAPKDITATAYRNQITVKWQQPEVPNGNVTKYLLYYSVRKLDDLWDWEKVEVDNTSYSLHANHPESRYYLRVQAVSSTGAGIISNTVECISDTHYEPIELFLITEELVADGVEPNDDVKMRCYGRGLPIPNLYYFWEDDEFNEEMVADEGIEKDEDTYEFSAYFEKSTAYNRTVICRAENKFENISAATTLVVKKPGDAPSSIQWRFEDDSRLFINWNQVQYPNGNVSYHLYLSESDVIVPGPPILWNKDEIPLNMNLSLYVAAVNEWGEGEKSAGVIITTLNGGPRDAPRFTAVNGTTSSVSLQWRPPMLSEGEITFYRLEYTKVNEEIGHVDDETWRHLEVAGNMTELTITEPGGLTVNSKFAVKISARNELNWGPWSEVEYFDTYEADSLYAPENVTAVLSNNSLTVILPPPHKYKHLIVYIRPINSDKYWRYEAKDIQVNQEKITIEDFPLDRNARYRMKVAGVVGNRETEHSEEFLLEMESQVVATQTEETTTSRRLVKEPPLI